MFWWERNHNIELNYLTKSWRDSEDGDVVIKYASFGDILWWIAVVFRNIIQKIFGVLWQSLFEKWWLSVIILCRSRRRFKFILPSNCMLEIWMGAKRLFLKHFSCGNFYVLCLKPDLTPSKTFISHYNFSYRPLLSIIVTPSLLPYVQVAMYY